MSGDIDINDVLSEWINNVEIAWQEDYSCCHQWMRFKDIKPKTPGYYLGVFNIKGKIHIKIIQYILQVIEDKIFCHLVTLSGFSRLNLTHWMPLPKPPEIDNVKMKYIDPEETIHEGMQNRIWVSKEDMIKYFPEK